MNVTSIWLCRKLLCLTYLSQLVPQRIISANVEHGTAAGINFNPYPYWLLCLEISSYTVALLLIQNVRASEELPKISFPGTEYCCSTLSDEGVCNTIVLVGQTRFVSCSTISYEGVCNIFRDSNNNVYELSYPLRWGCLQHGVGFKWPFISVVLPSQMRVSATFARKRGVYFSRLSYPLIWGCLQ